jgi:hypothetical protein
MQKTFNDCNGVVVKTFGNKVKVNALLDEHEANEFENDVKDAEGYYLVDLAMHTAKVFDECEAIAFGTVNVASELASNEFEITLTDGTKLEYIWDGFYCLAYMLKITKNEQVIFDYNFGCVQQTETVDELINKINDDIDNNNAYGFFTIAFTWMLEKLNASS